MEYVLQIDNPKNVFGFHGTQAVGIQKNELIWYSDGLKMAGSLHPNITPFFKTYTILDHFICRYLFDF
jgi:hypothetical protein